MEELAAAPIVAERLPFVREALLLGASTQLRNMATIGGNLLQRTRCRYFRDPTVAACNKRDPGSGCAALTGFNRMHAILGVSQHCIALHASDLAVTLMALDAVVHTQGQGGMRRIPLTKFYREPGDTPDIETVLEHGEIITAVEIPFLPDGARTHYLKVRDRASYEFALTSAGVALVIEDGRIREARVGLGGVGTIPWRADAAEALLAGAPVSLESFRAAAEAALAGAVPQQHNAFKVELAKRTLVRALATVAGEVS
jgi:xanthine dehydrogenase YagS FAD-binding subunit